MATYEIYWEGVPGEKPSPTEFKETYTSRSQYAYDITLGQLFRTNSTNERKLISLVEVGTPQIAEAALVLVSSTAQGTNAGPCVRSGGTGHSDFSGYIANISGDSPFELRLTKYFNGSVSQVKTGINTKGLAPATGYCAKIRAEETSLKAKFWALDTSEPLDWDIEASDSSLTAGEVGIFSVNTGTYKFGKLSIGTDGSSAPALYYQLTGTVRDENNNPVECDVVAIDRITKHFATQSKSTSGGSFTLNVPKSNPYAVIAFDDVGNRNAVIKDKIVPIAL